MDQLLGQMFTATDGEIVMRLREKRIGGIRLQEKRGGGCLRDVSKMDAAMRSSTS